MKCQLPFLFIVSALTVATYAQNCAPLNCPVSCTPSCSVEEVCTLSTMVTCGVCPGSKCMSRAALGLPPINTTGPVANNNGGSGALIGGIVGGILGFGLLLGGGVFLFLRNRRKKNALPLAFRSPNQLHHLERTIPATVMDEEMQERMSGVIPVTFIPPSRPESTLTTSESEPPQSRYGSFSTFANHPDNSSENPFDDRPISNAHSIMSTSTNNYSRRGSIESTMSHQQVATVVQATQVLRARPTIMRVNTIKTPDGVKRSGSLKTIKPEPLSSAASNSNTTTPTTTATAVASEDNPFDDKNKIEPERKVTDSVVSAPGDGEITIFWNGS